MRYKPGIKLHIHYGGSIVKTDDSYQYIGEIGCKERIWKNFEIGWEKFEAFVRDEKIMSPLAMVWYKLPGEEMKDIKYVFDMTCDDMVEVQAASKQSGEIDVFLEHDCSSHSPISSGNLTSTQHEGRKDNADGDDENVGGYESGEEFIDRPREEDEGEQSEDEDQRLKKKLKRKT